MRDGQTYTSAGITAGIDLALALIEEDHGQTFALRVARSLVVFLKRPGGQSQFSTHLQAQFSAVPALRKAQEWALAHLAEDLSAEVLAAHVGMSERNFRRLFVDELHETPREYVERIVSTRPGVKSRTPTFPPRLSQNGAASAPCTACGAPSSVSSA